jgi:hypothetical protein
MAAKIYPFLTPKQLKERKKRLAKEHTQKVIDILTEIDNDPNYEIPTGRQHAPGWNPPDNNPTLPSVPEKTIYHTVREYIELYFDEIYHYPYSKNTECNMFYGGQLAQYCKFYNLPVQKVAVNHPKFKTITKYPFEILYWYFTGRSVIDKWLEHRDVDQILSSAKEYATREGKLVLLPTPKKKPSKSKSKSKYDKSKSKSKSKDDKI